MIRVKQRWKEGSDQVEVIEDFPPVTIVVELDRAPKDASKSAAIYAELHSNDLKIIRAIAEGDTARIEAHKASQAALRAQLIR